MRIALLTDGLWPLSVGGMQKHSFNLLIGLLDKGVEVLLYHPGAESIMDRVPEDRRSLLEEVIVPFPSSSPFPGSYLKASYLYSVGIARDLSARKEIEFVYAQGFSAWKLCEMRSKGEFNTPIGVNFHGLEMFQYAKGIKSKVIQWMFKGPVKYNLKNADVVYSLGGKLTSILETLVAKECIRVIPIAIDSDFVISQEKEIQLESVQVLFIGRYERRKGLIELNQAIDEFSDDDGIHFHMVGPIPLAGKSSSKLATYHGKVSDEKSLIDIIDSCDLLCVPSLAEGMPTVILEGMARGLAVIASDVGAVCELVDSQNGFLIEPGSSQAIVKAINDYRALDHQKRKELSLNSVNRVRQHYIWNKVIEQTLTDISSNINTTVS